MSSSNTDKKTSPLIRTKLNIPRTSGELVERPRLLDKLNQKLNCKVTLITAPAGFGKTTLVTTWLTHLQLDSSNKTQVKNQKVCWLSLDENDSDLSLFVGYVVAAIQTIFSNACPETNNLLQASPLPPVDYIATTLINEIVALSDTFPISPNKAGFIVVLDDYHRIGGQSAVHKLMSKLIEYQPRSMHLVLISRQDPVRLPLAQLRARREMVEIRQIDLRFDLAETGTFLRQALGISLPDDTIAILDKWVEGWVTGLQLASLSMHDLKDPAAFVQNLKGTDRYMMEYLVDEVLSHQSKAIQAFLLQTSILDRLCGPLCEAVTKIDDPECNGQAYLEWLEQTNIFLTPLDNQQKWYRYHHLFQDLLADKLRAEHSADKIRELHRLAGKWYADRGYVDETIQHALAANDIELAVTTVEANSQQLLNRFEQQTLVRWLSLLPEDAVWQRPKLLLVQAWLLFLQWRLTALETILDQAETLLESDTGTLTGQEKQFIDGQIQTLRSLTVYMVHNNFQRSLMVGQQALRQLPPAARGARGVALYITAFSRYSLGQQDVAIRQLKQVIEDSTPHGPAKIQAFLGLSFLYLMAGDLPRMRQISDHFLAFASGNKEPNAVGGANYAAGLLNYEWNNLPAAETHFSRMVDLRYRANFLAGFGAGLALARIYRLRGELEQAQIMIDRLKGDTLQINNTDLLPGLEAAQAELWLSQGNVAAAVRWAQSFQADVTRGKILKFELPLLAKVRILVKHGTEADARELQKRLETELVDLETHHFTYRAIQSRAHLALVYNRLGLVDDALETLRRAVNLAQPGGLIRSFADCGSGLLPLLMRLDRQGVTPTYLPQLLAAFDSLGHTHPPVSSTPNEPELIDLLTEREEEVVLLFEAGLTNQEIANKLVISLTTVKKHSSNIFGKLDVKNRRQAVYKAKRLGLIPS